MKLRRHAAACDRRDIIEAVDDAQQELWRRLVLADRAWFVQVSTAVTSLTAGTFSYNFDADFHQIYFFEVTEAGKENVVFSYAAMGSDGFKKRRRSTATVQESVTEFFYDVIGDNPAQLVLAGGLPTTWATLAVQIFYVRQLAKVSTEAATLDSAVVPFLGPLAARAAAQVVCSINPELALKLEAEWDRAVPEIAALTKRQVADPELTGSQRDSIPHPVSEGGRL